MNQDHTTDDVLEARIRADLRALAGDDAPTLASRVPLVAGRVRRRRTARTAGLATAGLGLVALVAVPFALATVSPAPAPDPADGTSLARPPFQDGLLPDWMTADSVPANGIACGADASDLQPTDDDPFAMKVTGGARARTHDGRTTYEVPFDLTTTLGPGATYTVPAYASLAWVQDDRIVALGSDPADVASALGSDEGTSTAPGDVMIGGTAASTDLDTCRPPVGIDPASTLAPGTYTVVPYVLVSSSVATEATWAIASDAVRVTIRTDGSITSEQVPGDPPATLTGEISRAVADQRGIVATGGSTVWAGASAGTSYEVVTTCTRAPDAAPSTYAWSVTDATSLQGVDHGEVLASGGSIPCDGTTVVDGVGPLLEGHVYQVHLDGPGPRFETGSAILAPAGAEPGPHASDPPTP